MVEDKLNILSILTISLFNQDFVYQFTCLYVYVDV